MGISEIGELSQKLNDKAKLFETYASNQDTFNEAKTNLGKEVTSITDALSETFNAMDSSQKSTGTSSTASQSSTSTIIDSLKVSTASVTAIQDALTGKVSVSDMSTVADNVDKGWDSAYSIIEQINPTICDAFVEAYEESHPLLYSAGSAIKNNSSDLLTNLNSVMTGISGWSGSYGEPDEAANKINTNVQNIATGTANMANTLKKMADSVCEAAGIDGEWINHYLEDGVNIATNLGGAAASLTQSGASGIGSFYSAKSGIEALKHGDIASATGYFSSAISGGLSAASSAGKAAVGFGTFKNTWEKDHAKKQTDLKPGEDEKTNNETKEDEGTGQSEADSTNSNNNQNASSKKASTNSQGGKSVSEDDYSADMINEINVVLDGSSSSQNSSCTINGEKYKLSAYFLSQELLQPMLLNFSIEKDDKVETQSDVVFADSTQIIGKSFEINVSTIKTSQEDSKAQPQKAFALKGMIIDVSASRATASKQSANVTVASWDALLQNAPHCRSFENMTLKDIISSVVQPYEEIKSEINPRFKEKIPYIVQYNQSDYAFIKMLAIRFGEWMYSTGETFIFGDFHDENGSTANLEYPGGSLMSYNLHQSIASFASKHLLADYYQFGKEKSIVEESCKDVADGTVNDWTDKAYNASQVLYKNERTAILSSGGFDNGKDEEGVDILLENSTKIKAQGEKTGLMTVQGKSKLAMLKIGQTFLIRDNVQNKSGESKDIEQKALRIIGVNHSFDYKQEYSNSFTAIPVACNYPSYSDADVHPMAPTQRAKVVENADEQKLGRVRVQFPWQEVQDKEMKTPWLRIALPYAGNEKGHHFIPEIGEEVMIGFEMNNAERPYIIGALYNGGDGKMDEKWASANEENNTKNNIKAIRSRNGHTILFNDKGDAGLLEIYDNKGNTYHITLSADDKKISIYSAGVIEVTADSDVNVKAKGNVTINADGDIGIKSKGNISMEAGSEVSIQASKVKVR